MNCDGLVVPISCDAPTTPRAPTHRFHVEVRLTSTRSNIWLLDRVYEWIDLNTAGDVEVVSGTDPNVAERCILAGAEMQLKCDGHHFAVRVITEQYAAHRALSVASSVPLPQHLVNELEERLGERRDD